MPLAHAGEDCGSYRVTLPPLHTPICIFAGLIVNHWHALSVDPVMPGVALDMEDAHSYI